MYLIDEHAEEKLEAALEALRATPFGARILAFHWGEPMSEARKETLFALAQQHLAGINAEIYICEDGDAVLLAASLPVKNANAFMLAMGEHLNRPVEDSWVTFTDAAVSVHRVLRMVSEKRDRQRAKEEAKRKQAEQREQERKRASILNRAVLADAASIASRRAARETAELMMIEDDVFTSRLVENVMQKKYAITALKEATYALDTYARIAPDLLFLDINLPNVTGHELLERILAIDPQAHIVMLSGNADQKNISQAMAYGAKGFIAKPFTREKLLQYIDRCPNIAARQPVNT